VPRLHDCGLLCLYVCVTDVVHMTCRSVTDNAQSDLQPVADLLFNTPAAVDDTGMYRGSIEPATSHTLVFYDVVYRITSYRDSGRG